MMDTSLSVAILALLAAVFGPTITSWFAMRQAAQEREHVRSSEDADRRESLRRKRFEFF